MQHSIALQSGLLIRPRQLTKEAAWQPLHIRDSRSACQTTPPNSISEIGAKADHKPKKAQSTRMPRTCLVSEVQSSQKTPPHVRQWCRRSMIPKSFAQSGQNVTESSSCHLHKSRQHSQNENTQLQVHEL